MADKLTDKEVNEMLDKLKKHFNEPVKPISQYCKAFYTWKEATEHSAKNVFHEESVLNKTYLMIIKSNLLWRLLYLDEPLRTEKCPKHDGRWSGINTCTYGCASTGWLLTPDLVEKRLNKLRKFYHHSDEEAINLLPKLQLHYENNLKNWDVKDKYKEYCEWVTLLGQGDLVPEKDRG